MFEKYTIIAIETQKYKVQIQAPKNEALHLLDEVLKRIKEN